MQNLENDFLADGGEFREVKIGDLFEIRSSKEIFHANQIDEILDTQKEGFYPYVVRTTQNNGVRGYINRNEASLNPANTLSFAQDTFSVFYQKQPYFTGNKVKILVSKLAGFSQINAIYFMASLQKVLCDCTWGLGSTVESIGEIKFRLPFKNGKPAFKFMEDFISELEAERISELEAYLRVTNLCDYKLTAAEMSALNAFNNLQNAGGVGANSRLSISFKEFKITELFAVGGSKTTPKSTLEQIGVGKFPYVTTQATQNGIAGHYNFWSEKGDCLTVDSAVLGTCFYQKENFSASDHVEILRPKFDFNAKIALYLATAMNKNAVALGYSYARKRSQKAIKEEKIFLPVLPTGEIDFKFMETLIKAIQKQVIKGVVKYADAKIAATKSVVAKQN